MNIQIKSIGGNEEEITITRKMRQKSVKDQASRR